MANYTEDQSPSKFVEMFPEGDAKSSECASNLVLTADLLLNNIAQALKPFDLSPASGIVLSSLADSGDPLSPHEIAERLIVSRATVTGLVDSLEKRGYARRCPHPTDRRMLLVEITDKGRQVADEFRPLVHGRHRASFELLDENDKERFMELLRKIQVSLKGSAG